MPNPRLKSDTSTRQFFINLKIFCGVLVQLSRNPLYNLILGINEIAAFFSGLLFYKLPSRLKTGRSSVCMLVWLIYGSTIRKRSFLVRRLLLRNSQFVFHSSVQPANLIKSGCFGNAAGSIFVCR